MGNKAPAAAIKRRPVKLRGEDFPRKEGHQEGFPEEGTPTGKDVVLRFHMGTNKQLR